MIDRPAPRVLLVGMMGVGKTTVGHALAGLTGWPYLDNDELVRRTSGHPTPELLATADEPTLRRVEASALDQALAADPPVVAGVAGGAVEDPAARERMAGAFVVYLHAPVDLLAQRVEGGPPRPWLGDDPAGALEHLYRGREALYRSVADLVLEVDRATPVELARAILGALPGDGPAGP